MTSCFPSNQGLTTLGQSCVEAAAARFGIERLWLEAEGFWSWLGSAFTSAKNAQAQTKQAMEEVVRLVEDAERQGREAMEAANTRVQEAERAVTKRAEEAEMVARRQREEHQRELTALRGQVEEEQRQRSAFEQKANLLQSEANLLRTNKECLEKVLANRETELASKCSRESRFSCLSLGLRVRSKDGCV